MNSARAGIYGDFGIGGCRATSMTQGEGPLPLGIALVDRGCGWGKRA